MFYLIESSPIRLRHPSRAGQRRGFVVALGDIVSADRELPCAQTLELPEMAS